MTESRTPKINPYPGLRPFQADETHLFFGRDEQRTELLGRLRKSQFLAVVGTSGSGKSSLVRAGLLPGLYGGFMAGGASRWRIVDTRPGGDPIGRLATALDEPGALQVADEEEDDISFTEATLRRSSLGLINVIKEAHLQEGERVLILVDQFEELFRFIDTAQVDGAKDDASAFVRLLLAAAQQDELPIYVVLTMRSDFLGDCARFRSLPEAINDGQYLIPRLTRDQRREAITGPASVAGVNLSPTLVNRLLNDVGDTPDQLPILQHALMRTFDHWQAQRPDASTIDLEDYEAVGGMKKALSRHADAVLKGLAENVSVAEGRRRKQIAEKMFRALTDMGKGGRKVRRLARLQDIADVASANVEEVVSIIDAFRQPTNSFLMPPIGEELVPDSYIDISHESLIRNWKKLDKWVDEETESAENYMLLAQKAERHQQQEEDLLSRPALRSANQWKEKQQPTAAWAKRYDPAFETAMDYLAKSDAKVTAGIAAQVRKRRIVRATVISAVLILVTPLLVLLNSGGQDFEESSGRMESVSKFANGGADLLLSSFYDAHFDNSQSMNFWDSDTDLGAHYELIYGDMGFLNNETVKTQASWLADILLEHEAYDHANIISDGYDWQSEFGQGLLDAIWYGNLPAETLIAAIQDIEGAPVQSNVTQPELDDLLDQLDEGRFEATTPVALFEAVWAPLQNAPMQNSAEFQQLLKKLESMQKADQVLAEVYRMRKDGRFDIDDFSAISDVVGPEFQFRKQHDIAEKAIFLTQRNRLRELLDGPTNQLESRKSELMEMLEVFGRLEVSLVADVPESEKAPVEESANQLEATATGQSAAESKVRRSGKPTVELTISELQKRFKELEAESQKSRDDSRATQFEDDSSPDDFGRSLENRRKIAFVWTVRKLIELVDKNSSSGLSGGWDEIEGLRRHEIADSLTGDQTKPFTLWNVRDNELYDRIKQNDWYQKVTQAIVLLKEVIYVLFAWVAWAWFRRYRARLGKTFASKVGTIRLGFAAVADVFSALAFSVVLTTFLAFGGALVVAVGYDTFQHTDIVLGICYLIAGPAAFVGYLLVRDVVRFRFHRSVGKILFECRPVLESGRRITWRASASRNWPILIGLIVASFIALMTIGIALTDAEVMSVWVLLLIIFEYVLILGLFEKLGSRRSKSTVIDTRSAESSGLISSAASTSAQSTTA